MGADAHAALGAGQERPPQDAAVLPGPAAPDAAPGAGLARGVLHEVLGPCAADAGAASGFGLALAGQAAAGRPLLWARHDRLDAETGRPYPPGLAALGADPAGLILVRARDAEGALQAGLEGARCAALGAVLIELLGAPRALDRAASRRLALAAGRSGVPVLLLRHAAAPEPNAAVTRWQVRAAPSRPLPANAPGHPALAVTLLRHRGGAGPQDWLVEWNRDARRFDPILPAGGAAVSRALVPVPLRRPADPGRDAARRAG